MCGVLAAPALAKALHPALRHETRIARGALYAGLSIGSCLSSSVQGPTTLVISTFSVVALRAIQLSGRRRVIVALGVAVAVVVGLGPTVLGLIGIGPMTWLWDSPSAGFRKIFWSQALNMANDIPVFCTGPDGLARFIGGYRTEETVRIFGHGDYLSAAHNVPLQCRATIGYVALVAWTALFVSALTLLIIAAWRCRSEHPWKFAAVGGALTAYAAQAHVSIDALDLKAVGWLALGLSFAVVQPKYDAPRSAVTWSPGASFATVAFAGGVGLMLCLPMVGVVNSVQTVTTVEDAQALVSGPLTPCRNRTASLQQIVAVTPPDRLGDLIGVAQSTDPRRPALESDLGRAVTVAGDPPQG